MEPSLSLALAMHAHPGAYALLLGSGISRPARIPTGWEVVLDLIAKLAVASGESAPEDPVGWYRERYGSDADYSDLLARLARHPVERQQLLRGYFEPDDADREEGWKQPTDAHRAIAKLCRLGYVRVIVTTNFDRLLEQALAAEGLHPTVVSTPDAVKGAPPLVHTSLLVVKLHGDYLDTRIRNTAGELEAYPRDMSRLLDRIFAEFGLVVCGWSARWDPALRAALERCANQRYTTFWTGVDEPEEQLRPLLNLRKAEFIRVAGANEFFVELTEKVLAVEEHARPHPMSVESAVAAAKRYLADSRHTIRFHDLLTLEVERVVDDVTSDRFDTEIAWSAEEFHRRVRAFEGRGVTLQSLLAVSAYWGNELHHRTLRSCVERIASIPDGDVWRDLRRYPGTLALYAGGVAAMAGERWTNLYALLLSPKFRSDGGSDRPALARLNRPGFIGDLVV